MNADDVKWLLQTIKGAETAERFVVAQYERGRISLEVMPDIACERPASAEECIATIMTIKKHAEHCEHWYTSSHKRS